MKKAILIISVTLLLVAGPAMAQMMGSGQMMGGGQDSRSSQQMMSGDQDTKSNQQMMEQQRSESPQEVLEKRFAKGEISQEEFENAMEVLRRHKE